MKLFSYFFFFWVIINISNVSAQNNYHKDKESCTSIMVGKKASADGSVITSHTCDSWYRTWLDITPAADYKNDTIMNIYNGLMHTETSTDMTNVKITGTIPQVSHTFSFLNTAYPCINEKQLAMGETTISGRSELENPKGMFMIEELQRIAMQRCTTARQAISLMGELIKKYGYGDSGECLTIADKDEIWHFEVFGEGKKKIGGVWAAVRIPDDHIGVSANISRISNIDIKNKDMYMASDNVFEVAKKLGYWDGKEPFKFWKAYSGKNYFDEIKSFSIREFFILNHFAPSLHLNYDSEELPLSVKPEKPVSARDVMAMLRQTYEGTEWDMTKNLKIVEKTKEKTDTIISPKANPWMRNDEIKMINAIKEGTIKQVRNISVPHCAYSTVIQLRSWLPNAVGGVVWFSMDNPGQSPRIPIFCGIKSLPSLYKICGNHRYRDDAALWHYRVTNKLAATKWGAYKDMFIKNMNHFEEKGLNEMTFVEQTYKKLLETKDSETANEFLTEYTTDFIGAAILKWDEMGKKIWIDSRFGL